MKLNSEEMRNLVGPSSDERGNQENDEFHSKNGEPLWMALLSDEDTLVLKPDVVQEAKNRLAILRAEHSDEVKACMNKTTKECREILSQFSEAA